MPWPEAVRPGLRTLGHAAVGVGVGVGVVVVEGVAAGEAGVGDEVGGVVGGGGVGGVEELVFGVVPALAEVGEAAVVGVFAGEAVGGGGVVSPWLIQVSPLGKYSRCWVGVGVGVGGEVGGAGGVGVVVGGDGVGAGAGGGGEAVAVGVDGFGERCCWCRRSRGWGTRCCRRWSCRGWTGCRCGRRCRWSGLPPVPVGESVMVVSRFSAFQVSRRIWPPRSRRVRLPLAS